MLFWAPVTSCLPRDKQHISCLPESTLPPSLNPEAKSDPAKTYVKIFYCSPQTPSAAPISLGVIANVLKWAT